MKKLLMIIGGVVVVAIIAGVAIFLFVSKTSSQLVCKSAEGNVTIMYNDTDLTGYTSGNGLSYDLEGQREVARALGIPGYLDAFESWFLENTTGSCTRK